MESLALFFLKSLFLKNYYSYYGVFYFEKYWFTSLFSLKFDHFVNGTALIFQKRNINHLVLFYNACFNINTIHYRFIKYNFRGFRRSFWFLDFWIFLKTLNGFFNVLFKCLQNFMFFFVFSKYNIMESFFNVWHYHFNFWGYGRQNAFFAIKHKSLHFYDMYNTMYDACNVHNVRLFILIEENPYRYPLTIFKSPTLVLFGLVSSRVWVKALDYFIIVKEISALVTYLFYNMLAAIYFGSLRFFQWQFFKKFNYYYFLGFFKKFLN
jgi:hypothetical protein